MNKTTMHKNKLRISLVVGGAAVALLVACGGGGGGGTGGGGNPPTTAPTATPTTSPTATPTQGASGTLSSANGSPIANASVVFTCGCSAQAGTTTADGSGNYTIAATSTATPAAPSPTYTTVPGRNYLVIGANAQTHQESWTMFFLGNQPSHNVYIGNGNADTTDVATTAAALYVFQNSYSSATAFDTWNLNTIGAWAQKLRSGSVTPQEQKLLSDITSASVPLYPSTPAWDNDPGTGTANTTIGADINAIKSAANDPAVPTPCRASGCIGAPSP